MENARNTAVKIYVYDLSRANDNGWFFRSTASSLRSMTSSSVIPHLSIIVFGLEYSYGMDGISTMEPSRENFRAIDHGVTSKNRIELELFIDRLRERGFISANYDLRTKNCIDFANELSNFLLGVPIPNEFLNVPEELIRNAAYVVSGLAAGIVIVVGRMHNVDTQSCIRFANMLSKSLLGVTIANEFLNIPEEMIDNAVKIVNALVSSLAFGSHRMRQS